MYLQLRRILLSVGALAVLGGILFLFVWNGSGRKKAFVIAAGSKGGESFALSESIARVVQRYHPDLNLKVIETKGSIENLGLLKSGQADFATVQADVNADLQTSSKADRLRMVAVLFEDHFQLLARAEAEVKSFTMVRGKRVAVPPAGGGQHASFIALLEHLEIATNSLTITEMVSGEALTALVAGEVDAVFQVRAVPNPAIQVALENENISLVRIGGIDALRIYQPVLNAGAIPEGAYSRVPLEPPVDVDTVAVPRLLLARQNLDDSVVRDITQVLFEHRWELVRDNNLAAYIASPDRAKGLAMPVHEGSQSYYDREKPSFLQANAEPIALVLSVLALIGSGLLALKSYVDSAQKDRVDRHNLRLLAMRQNIAECESIDALDRRQEELYQILEEVVREVDNDRVNADGFHYFSFTWNALREAVRDRRAVLSANVQKP